MSEKKNCRLDLFCFVSREQISEMLCELYSPSIAMPEAPKQNFFAKLFASNSMVDTDQLCRMMIFSVSVLIKKIFFRSW